VVKQRLKLAAVSPKLLDLYAEDAMTLEQLMAFTVTDDHARQEQEWDSLARSYNKGSHFIRRQLTEGAVSAADKRAQFVGLDAYQAAGGIVTRDLFEDDDGGWLQDTALIETEAQCANSAARSSRSKASRASHRAPASSGSHFAHRVMPLVDSLGQSSVIEAGRLDTKARALGRDFQACVRPVTIERGEAQRVEPSGKRRVGIVGERLAQRQRAIGGQLRDEAFGQRLDAVMPAFLADDAADDPPSPEPRWET
jgi:hypothetical protein